MQDFSGLVEQLKVVLAETKENIADKGGWDFETDLRDVYEGLMQAAAIIEASTDEWGEMSDAEKKEALANTANWLIDIPWVPEALEAELFKLVASLAWVAYLDRKNGDAEVA